MTKKTTYFCQASEFSRIGLHSVCLDNRYQNVFCNIFYKTRRFWWNLVGRLLNKFAVTSCKLSPLRLNNVSTLPCETWNAYRVRATIELSEKNVRIYPTLTVASKFAIFESRWLQHVENTAKEGVQNTHRWSGGNEKATENWVGHAGSRRHCDSNSPVASSIGPNQWCLFCISSLAVFPHARPIINGIQIWRIWRPRLRWDKSWSFFFNNSGAR